MINETGAVPAACRTPEKEGRAVLVAYVTDEPGDMKFHFAFVGVYNELADESKADWLGQFAETLRAEAERLASQF